MTVQSQYTHVLGCALTAEPERVMPPGAGVRPIGADEFETWLGVVAEGAAYPDTQGVPWHEEFPREMVIGAERDMAAAVPGGVKGRRATRALAGRHRADAGQ